VVKLKALVGGCWSKAKNLSRTMSGNGYIGYISSNAHPSSSAR
jgi:hypothetical protein